MYKSSKTRNHLKPENLETLFLLSALKMSIKSATSYQAEKKCLQTSNSPLIFWFCYSILIFQHSNVFLFNDENKIFRFFKKWFFPFLDISRGELSSPKKIFFLGGGEGLLRMGGVWDRFRIFGGGLSKKGWGQYFRVGLIPWRTLWLKKSHCQRAIFGYNLRTKFFLSIQF